SFVSCVATLPVVTTAISHANHNVVRWPRMHLLAEPDFARRRLASCRCQLVTCRARLDVLGRGLRLGRCALRLQVRGERLPIALEPSDLSLKLLDLLSE